MPLPKTDFHKRGSGKRSPFGWKADGGGTFKSRRPGFSAEIGRDGRVKFKDKSTGMTSLVTGVFDITDTVMRATGRDPYLAAKVAMLDESRNYRARMGLRERKERLDESLRWLPEHLEKVWRMPGFSIEEKKRALFELWDECAEKGDPEVLSTAAGARRIILRFIRSRLPRGSATAFSKAEIARHNRERQSRSRFAPYSR